MKSFKEFLKEKVVAEDKYYQTALEFFLNKYGVDTKKYNVVLKEKMSVNSTDGLTVPASKTDFVIFIKKNHPQADKLRVIAHEASHVAQIVNGDMEFKKSEGGIKVYWKGEEVDIEKTPYKRRPWEIEAFTLEKRHIHDFIKQHGNKLNESVDYIDTYNWEREGKPATETLIKAAKKMGSAAVLWRAQNNPNRMPIYLIDNTTRKAYMGKILDQNGKMQEVYDALGFKYPPTYTNPGKANTYFGSTIGIFIPKSKFTAWQSKLVSDSASIAKLDDVDEVIKSYKKNSWSGTNEVIIDTEQWWFVNVKSMVDNNHSKFKDINNINQLKTYKDVVAMLFDYLKWNNYINQEK